MMMWIKKTFTFELFRGVVLLIFSLAFVVQIPQAKAGEYMGTIKGVVNSPYVSR